MVAKDDGVATAARGELALKIDGVDRIFVFEMGDVLMIEETSGMGVSALFSNNMAGVRPAAIALACGILYEEPTMSVPRMAKMIGSGKPIVYNGPDVQIGRLNVKRGDRIGMLKLYNLVRHFVHIAIPNDPEDDDKTADERLKEKLPPGQAAGS
jgi:hypothetical protein